MKFKDDYQEPYNAENMWPILSPEEQIGIAQQELNNAAKVITENLVPAIQAMIPTIQAVINSVVPIVKNMFDLVVDHYPNKRVLYLAIHGKHRVRKKNIKRITKWIERLNDD